jgi:EAL domain-containing protein (putative c-di-GMP-specific phosphodiesterase class I)/signal transduction histidine kinase/response regulator RpfG family c-di-GMP phosphodiesterase
MQTSIVAVAIVSLLIVALMGAHAHRLRQSGRRFREQAAFQKALFDSVDAAIVSTTPEGVIDSVNRGAEILSGYSAAELIGRPVLSFVPDVAVLAPQAAALSRELGREIKPGFEVFVAPAREGRHDTREWEMVRKDGVRLPVLLSVSAIHAATADGGASGNHAGFIGIAREISAGKQAEQELIAARDAAQLANRGKDTFLATMSHEIRTPLGGIQGLLELLSLTTLDNEQRKTLQTARESADGLLRILNDILDWSSLESGKLQLVPQAASLAQILARVANTYAHAASARNLTLEWAVEARLGPAHVVDPLRLSQVLNNFVSNAIKFTMKGSIDLRATLLERREGADRVRFSVTDTGKGIEPAAQAQVFERYVQQATDAGRMYGGTGLGLSICRRLAQAMGGAIELDSTPGSGSTFSLTLTLPTAPATSLPAPAASPAEEPVPQPLALAQDATKTVKPLVLVVDDNSVNRMILAAQLARLGMATEIADNGEAALALWQAKPFALIITDCHMPKMDGYQLARAIRGIESERTRTRTPILAWTANAMPAEADACREAGMDELLIKPMSMAQLRVVLSQWLTNEAPGTAQATAAVARSEPIDPSQLDNIAADEDQKSAILAALLTQSRTDQADLRNALERKDIPAVVRIAHRMKGASRMVGANELAAASEAMEFAGKQGRLQHADEVLPALARLMQWLEAHRSGASSVTAQVEALSAANGLIVMVVEDHDFQRLTVAGMLRALGAREVLQAGDGRQAITLMQEALPAAVDLVVCDLDMPHMDGMEFIRHLGAAKNPASVIITSAKERALLSSVEQMAKAYGVTLLGVIEKPVTRDALEAQIENYSKPRLLSTSRTIVRGAAPEFTLDDVLPGLAQQIEPFFQPKVQLSNGRIVGAEALARWRHPMRGIIAPYAFIPLLEQSGNIDALTLLMLEKSAVSCCKWRAAGIDCSVSVNLSLTSLADTSLADRITQLVRSTGLAPQDMTLEVTETTAMTDVAPALENLTRLRMHGFGLSIDDYGTGFSSMQQLTRVPFTELKIDQSFVRGFGSNTRLRPIVESSVEMARRLNIKSVAEGAESQADWDALKAIGCDQVQGYFVARPLDEASFVKFCVDHSAGVTANGSA